ncbi:ATP-binding cassette domain-containing protein, partial [bacterium]|nr:ATP-binding cassette domain-containing protein [bacterium]
MIHLSNISKRYGNKVLYKNGHFQINPGEKIGLVGPNGAGKSTIFRMITGEESPDDGQISKPQKTVVGYFSQDIEAMSGRTVLEEVLSANGNLPKIEARLKHLEAQLSEPLDEDVMAKVLEEYGDLQGEFERQGGYEAESRAKEVLTGLGIGVNDQDRDTSTFSGGWKMRIALAKILVLQPDVLLMDEPTNHLDIESILWLEEWLVNFKGSILMTSHDRDFMNRIVSKIVEVAHQTITAYSGNYDFYEKEKVLRLEQLHAAARRQEDMLAKEKEFIAR